MRKAILAGVLVVTVGLGAGIWGTWSVSGASSSTVPKAPKSATRVKTVTLTYSSNNSTVLATEGDKVVVKLSGHHLRWSEAQAVQSTPVLTFVSGSTSSSGASKTAFTVTGYGSAQLQATGTPICAASVACPQYILLWHVTVESPVIDPGTAA